MSHLTRSLSLVVLAVSFLVAGCATNSAPPSNQNSTLSNSTGTSSAQTNGEKPIPPEQNPTGDIPDTQTFISFHSSTRGYQVDAPEGWARSAHGSNVSFVDKFDGESITVTSGKALSASQLLEVYPASRLGRAVQVQSVTAVTLPHSGLKAVRVDYTSNSDPNPVTGKQVRLENNSYFFFKSGKVAKINLWAPLGSDNVDQWNRISQSFRW